MTLRVFRVVLLAMGCGSEPAHVPAAPVRPPNIVLVSLDTTRADHTTPYGARHDTTPTLARLAAEGTLFAHAFSQSNESAYSHGALFTGRYASELAEPTYATYGLPDQATLASEALRAYGYRTGMFSAGGHVSRDYGFDQGWDRASFETGFGSIWDTGFAAVEWIDQGPAEQPYFVFIHGYDAHRPYSREGFWDHLFSDGPGSEVAEVLAKSPCLSEMVRGDTLYPELVPSWFRHSGGAQVMDPASYDRLADPPEDTVRVPVTAADKAHVQAHYDGSVRYSDTILGVVLARLEAAGRLENTVVLVTADHGEDLLDHGYMNHRTGLWDTRVPRAACGVGTGLFGRSGGGRARGRPRRGGHGLCAGRSCGTSGQRWTGPPGGRSRRRSPRCGLLRRRDGHGCGADGHASAHLPGPVPRRARLPRPPRESRPLERRLCALRPPHRSR
jgi:hypothetical protein